MLCDEKKQADVGRICKRHLGKYNLQCPQCLGELATALEDKTELIGPATTATVAALLEQNRELIKALRDARIILASASSILKVVDAALAKTKGMGAGGG